MQFCDFQFIQKGLKVSEQCQPGLLFQKLMPQTEKTHGLWFLVWTWEQSEEPWSDNRSKKRRREGERQWEWDKKKKKERNRSHSSQPQTSAWRLWLQSVINQSQNCHWPRHLSGPEPYMKPPIYTFHSCLSSRFTITFMAVYWVHQVRRKCALCQ